jgi:hypothetical protein
MARAKKSKSKLSELEGQPDPRAALDSAGLLSACRGVLARLEADLLERTKASPAVTRALEARYEAEKKAERTAESFAGWTALLATQVAAAWVLSCVFVRTLEDRGLLKQARLAGPGAEDSQRQFFQLAPSLTERDYLLTVFRELAHHPAAKDLFDARHSPIWKLSPSAAAAKELLALFRLPNATTPAFRFGQASTRFLGDLYQDISEDVRKRYALLQTPDFIESFILDRTLEPAIQRFGLDDTTLIDPTCGSGHFLLGAFERLFEHRLRAEPGVDVRVAAVKALDCVYGADINPYAVAIARFRLTLSFLEKAGYAKLADAPALPLHLVVADSLRINAQHPQTELWHQDGASSKHWLGEVFTLEDERAAKDVLFRQYAAVVGNPPYITVKDAAMREVYRKMYPAAAGKYALSAPFCERFFQLARPRGYTGQITANSFMKREFGKRLIEDVLSAVNLELIVNTSGAYVPGHGTPTVLLFGTHELPQGSDVLAVLAKRGEPSTPDDPSQGLVWRSIADHFSTVSFENDYISVARVARDALAEHPWSLGGGGASELKELLEERSEKRLGDIVEDIGFASFTGLDDAFILPSHSARTLGIEDALLRPMVIGESVRDWAMSPEEVAITPYSKVDHSPLPYARASFWGRFLWRYRTLAKNVASFGGRTREQDGENWWEWYRWQRERYETPFRITFAFVATHNHFVLDRGGKVFNRSAPIIKLPKGATEDDHLVLLAYLNSSTACFWMKQVLFEKSSQNYVGDVRDKPERIHYEFAGTALQALPMPTLPARVGAYAARLNDLAERRLQIAPAGLLRQYGVSADTSVRLAQCAVEYAELLCRMVVLQEEIDWEIYAAVGIVESDLLAANHGIEIAKFAATPESRPYIAEIHGDDDLCRLWRNRRASISSNTELALIEQPLHKRPWLGTQGVFHRDGWTYEALTEVAAVDALAAKIEHDLAARDPQIRSALELAKQFEAADGADLLAISPSLRAEGLGSATYTLLERESVPCLAAATFTESGLVRRLEWEQTWEHQRAEDAGAKIEISPPGKYGIADFRDANSYRLRGKLDVPKERFISYPGCESDNDGEPVYGWAGWDHLQRAKALGALYLNRKDVEGWTADRLTPMLAGLLELIPWVKQWHNEPSDEFGGLRMGDYYAQFLDGECRLHGLTHDDLRAWRPTKKPRGSGKAAAKAKAAKAEDNAAQEGNGEAGEEIAAAAPKKPRAKKRPAAAKVPPVSEEAE